MRSPNIFKTCWEIEIFFKTIKQNLKIKRFMGTSTNAVMTQVWIALIACLLINFPKKVYAQIKAADPSHLSTQSDQFNGTKVNKKHW